MLRRTGSGDEEVPSVFIDRSGAKLSLSEQYTRNSKGTFSFVVERVRHTQLPHTTLQLLLESEQSDTPVLHCAVPFAAVYSSKGRQD